MVLQLGFWFVLHVGDLRTRGSGRRYCVWVESHYALLPATNRPQKLTFNVQPVTALASENAGVLAPRAPSAFAFLDLTPCYEPAGTEVQHVTVLAPRPLHTLLSTRVKTWSCSTSVKRVSGPAYSEDIRDVFGRREPWFAVCQIQIWAVTGDISPSAATYNDILFQ